MSNERLRFAVIGCGRISQVHFTALDRNPNAELVAVADTDRAAAEGAAEAYGGKPFVDPLKMLEKVNPDAVILCTPPSSHRELAVAACEAGAHVLCEKPLAVTVDDAQAMLNVSAERGRQLMMATKFRYVTDIVKARAVIQSGILGEIILFENEFCSRVDMSQRWNSKKEIGGGGVLIDNGTHSVDIVRYLLGPVDEVQALFGKRWQPLEVEDTCRLFARSGNGTMASVDLSWSIHKQNPYFISLYGTEGMLQVGWQGSHYRQSEKMGWVEFGSGYDKFQAVGDQLENFIGTIRGTALPLITPEAALDSVRVIQAAYHSAEQSRWEKVAA